MRYIGGLPASCLFTLFFFLFSLRVQGSSSECPGNAYMRAEPSETSFVAHVGRSKRLDLRPVISIDDSCDVLLPIEVPHQTLAVDWAKATPVDAVSSNRPNGVYGVGDQIAIDVSFPSNVTVHGAEPHLELQTGCHTSECHIREVQKITCRANKGSFALGFRGNWIPNIQASSPPEVIKKTLEAFDGIEEVLVEYSSTDLSRTACSKGGNDIIVTFLEVGKDATSLDGDVYPIETDYLNAPISPRTWQKWGEEMRLGVGRGSNPECPDDADLSYGGTLLDAEGKSLMGSRALNGVELSPEAEEVVKGHRRDNAIATYAGGSGTTTLHFIYLVESEDFSEDLDCADQSSFHLNGGSIVGSNGVVANVLLPLPGSAADYRLGTGSSLSATKDIVIDTTPPFVVNVVSPDADRIYGTGELVSIIVEFNKNVVVDTSGGIPELQLNTGVFDQSIPFVRVSDGALVFEYTVIAGDSSPDLDYCSVDSLHLNGAFIYQDTMVPSTLANASLPIPGGVGSLSFSNDIMIRPTTPNVLGVKTSLPDGIYGAGQAIMIDVTFGWWEGELVSVEIVDSDGAELSLAMEVKTWGKIFSALPGDEFVVLVEGHRLDGDEMGQEFEFQGDFYAPSEIDGDVLSLNGTWYGPTVVSGLPEIFITSSGSEIAGYIDGNGTSTLTFLYVCQPGDSTSDLEYTGSNALSIISGGRIRRMTEGVHPAGDIEVVLPPPHSCIPSLGCSLGYNSDIEIDTNRPQALNLTTTKPSGQAYAQGEQVDVTVLFDMPVSVDDTAPSTPRLRMNTLGYASYVQGSGTAALTFAYTIGSDDSVASLDAWDAEAFGSVSALEVVVEGVEGYIRRTSTAPTTDAILQLPVGSDSGSLASFADITAEGQAPRMVGVNFTDWEGYGIAYGVGHAIELIVQFSAPVLVNGLQSGQVPVIYLDSGGVAYYASGSGSSSLTFTYDVKEGEMSPALDFQVSTEDFFNTTRIELPAGINITSLASTEMLASTSLLTGTLAIWEIIVDTTPASIIDVWSTHRDGTYGVGETIPIFVKYGAPVVIFDTNITLSLSVADGEAEAQFLALGNDSETLEFTYSVDDGHFTSDLDYLSSQSGLNVVPGGIRRESTNATQDASLLLPVNGQPRSLGMNNNIHIDAMASYGTSVSTVIPSQSVLLKAGRVQTLDIVGSLGSFSLAYRGFATDCLSAAGVSAGDIEAALEAANGALEVRVTNGTAPEAIIRRFEVEFDSPLVSVAPISVEEGACTGEAATVLINRDSKYPPSSGLVHVGVDMSKPILLHGGSVFVELLMDDNESRFAESGPSLIQYVDVGVNAPDPVLGGYFRLQYGDQITSCIDLQSLETTGNLNSFRGGLESIAEIAMIGVKRLDRTPLGNGFRFEIEFELGMPKFISIPSDPVSGCAVPFDPPTFEPTVDISVPFLERLDFYYVLQSNDTAASLGIGPELVLSGGASLVLASSSAIQPVSLTLAEPLLALSTVSVDCLPAPEVVSIRAATYGGTFGAGQNLYFIVEFSEPVSVNQDAIRRDQLPYIALNAGSESRATYYGGSGGTHLTFRYTVLESHVTQDLGPYSRTALSNNGVPIVAMLRPEVFADLMLPAQFGGSLDASPVVIDTQSPHILSLSTDKEVGDYGVGEEIVFIVQFSERIDVQGVPSLPLNSGGEALFTQRGTTQSIVIVPDDDLDFDITGPSLSDGGFRLSYGGELTACTQFSDPLQLASNLRNLASIGEDGVRNVTLSQYGGGVKFDITFSNGDGRFETYPLALEVPWNWYEGCAQVIPEFSRPYVHDSAELRFIYTVSLGEQTDSLVPDGDISLDEGESIYRSQSKGLTAADISIQSLNLTASGISIDADPAKVISVEGLNGTYTYGQRVDILVYFSAPVIASDATLELVLGKWESHLATRVADLDSSSKDSARDSLMFFFSVGESEATADLEYSSSEALGGSIFRASSNPSQPATLTLPSPGSALSLSGTSDVVIAANDTTTSIYRLRVEPSDGILKVGESATFFVDFTRRASFFGDISLEISIGEESISLPVTSPDSMELDASFSFLYTVLPAHSGHLLDALELRLGPDSYIRDVHGWDVDLTFPGDSSLTIAGSSSIDLDTSSTIEWVRSRTPDGTYYAGESIWIEVHYNYPVSVIGSPIMAIDAGETALSSGQGTYINGSGTNELLFEFVVREGDGTIRLGYAGSNSLFYPSQAEGSYIVAAHDESILADTTLPEAWVNEQLRVQADIIITTAPPVVISVETSAQDGSYGVGSIIDIYVQFSTRIHIHGQRSLPYLELGVENDLIPEGEIRTARYLGGNLTDTMAFRYEVVEGDMAPLFDYRDTRTWKRQMVSSPLVRPPGVTIRAASAKPTTDALLFFPLPGASGSISRLSSIAIDTTRPTIQKVWGLSPDGVYGVGDEILIGLEFSHEVLLLTGEDPAAAIPSLLLNIDSETTNEPRALYVSGNGTTTFTLSYTVQHGDYSPLLDYADYQSFSMYRSLIKSFERRDAKIVRASVLPSQDADLSLPSPGPQASLLGPTSMEGSGSVIVVQARLLKAKQVLSNVPDGIYPFGSLVELLVQFTVPVMIPRGVELPELLLAMDDGSVRTAILSGGNETSQLYFTYTVGNGDFAQDLEYIGLNGSVGCITTAYEGIAVYLWGLPPPGTPGSLSAESDITIDADYSLIDRVWSPLPDGTYGAGEVIDIYVSFTSMMYAVMPNETAIVLMAGGTNSSEVLAPYWGYDEETSAVIFRYEVQQGDSTPLLSYKDEFSLVGELYFESSYRASEPMPVKLPPPGANGSLSAEKTIAIDTSSPVVMSVSAALQNGVYTVGHVVDIIVRFSASVVFTSHYPESTLSLIAGTGGITANYTSGNQTSELIYSYTVGAVSPIYEGSSDLDYADTGALSVGNGELLRSSSNPITPAQLALAHRGLSGSLGHESDIIIDLGAARALRVTSDHPDGTYGTGEAINITVHFSDTVYVSGDNPTSDLHLYLNAAVQSSAVYCCGSGSTKLVFTYTVEAGDSTPDLDYAARDALLLPHDVNIAILGEGHRLVMLALEKPGEPGSLGYNSNIAIDGRAPWIVDVSSSTLNGVYGAGEEIIISVVFTYPVVMPASESPVLLIDAGPETIHHCAYHSGNGTDTFSWLYVVEEGDQSFDLSLEGFSDGSSLLRMSTSPTDEADLTLPTEGQPGSLSYNKDIVIDTSRPMAEHVIGGREGTFTAGQVLDFQIVFDKPVFVTGTPGLAVTFAVEGDSTTVLAEYTPDFSLKTILDPSRVIAFTYVIQEGDLANVVTYASAEALFLGAESSILRNSTHPVTEALLTLPAPPLKGLLTPVYAIEAAIFGLHHEDAWDLRVDLFHGGHSTLLAKGGGSSQRLHGDYHFSDEVSANLAQDPQAFTLQSSTGYGGVSSKATDGCTLATFGSGCSTMTEVEADPWWQVVLPSDDTTIRHAHIFFGGEESFPREEVQILSVRATTPLRGTFQLAFRESETAEAVYLPVFTVFMTADELKDALEAAAGNSFPRIQVSESEFTAPFSYHKSWTIRFEEQAGDVPQLELVEFTMSSSYPVVLVETLQQGILPGSITWNGNKRRISYKEGTEAWLFLFATEEDALTAVSFTDAMAQSSFQWYLGVRDGKPSEMNVYLGNVQGKVLRVQLDGKDRLSMTEVQLYSNAADTLEALSTYEVLPPRQLWNPLLSSVSMKSAFQGTTSEDTWTLSISDGSLMQENQLPSHLAWPFVHGPGSLSGWKLSLTDFFGTPRSFSMDFAITVETLPQHGKLFHFESGLELEPARGFESEAAMCASRLLQNSTAAAYDYPCTMAHQPKSSELSGRDLGLIARRNKIASGGDLVAAHLVYIPDDDFNGLDHFHYSVTVGGIKSATAVPVQISVGKCRLFDQGSYHPLCSCNSPGISGDLNKRSECMSVLENMCGDSPSMGGLGEPRQKASERLHAGMGAQICLACAPLPDEYDFLSGMCIAQTKKLARYLEIEGYCEVTYSIPICEDDLLTNRKTLPKIDLQKRGDWQTDETRVETRSESLGGACLCSQAYLECPCMLNELKRQIPTL